MKKIEDTFIKLSELKEELKKSIEQFGTWRSIGIDENNNVIFGNKLSMALKELGIKQTSAKRLIGYSEVELKAINIKDNEHVGEWDFDLKIKWENEIKLEMPEMDFQINENIKEKEVSELQTDTECPSCGYKW